MTVWSLVVLAVLATGCQPSTPTPPAQPRPGTPTLLTADRSVTFQINPQHDGRIPSSPLRPPLVERWSRTFPTPGTANSLSAPVVADGRVFFTGAIYQQTSLVYAVDQATGDLLWGPIAIGGGGHRSGVTYDNGRLFAGNADGEVFAFDPRTGRQLWHVESGGGGASITAADGLVYSGALYALRQSDGGIVWRRSSWRWGGGPPAVRGDHIYVTGGGPQVADISQHGVRRWEHDAGFWGGGGRTSVLHQDRLYARSSAGAGPLILDAATGARVGTFDSEYPPAFHDTTRFDTVESTELGCCTLKAVDVRTNRVLWTFSVEGDHGAGPVVIGDTVYVASWQGKLYGLDVRTGRVQWTADARGNIRPPDEHNMGGPLVGLGAGGGMLLVPVGARMVAYAPAAPAPSPNAQEVRFADQQVGSSSLAATVRITNQGRSRLDLAAARLSGPQAGSFRVAADRCSGASLATAASCSVQVLFAPGQPGAAAAELVVGGNAPTGPTRIRLAGLGAASSEHLDRYLDRTYRALLGRPVDPAARAHWRSFLTSGGTRRAFATTLVSSDEYREQVVRDSYLELLYRRPNRSEVTAGVALLRGGGLQRELDIGIFRTDEAWWHLPDQERMNEWSLQGPFVERLFIHATEAAPPAGESRRLVSQVAEPVGRAAVVASAFDRDAALAVRVRRTFSELLRRAPTEREQSTWVTRLRTGVPEADMALTIVASGEYFSEP